MDLATGILFIALSAWILARELPRARRKPGVAWRRESWIWLHAAVLELGLALYFVGLWLNWFHRATWYRSPLPVVFCYAIIVGIWSIFPSIRRTRQATPAASAQADPADAVPSASQD